MREESLGSEQVVNEYLTRMESALRGSMPPAQLRDIVQETRSHLLEHVERGSASEVRDALRNLGEPEQYAKGFLNEVGVQERTPPGMVRLVGHGVAGFLVLNLATICYGIAILLFAIAAIELLDPESIGVWVWDGADGRTVSLAYGSDSDRPPAARDLLGAWLAPIGLLGALVVYAGTTFGVRRWLARRERKESP